MVRFVYKQLISDKQVGATYITVLASITNFFKIITMNISYALINRIGAVNLSLLYIVFNGCTIFFLREKYIKYLSTKTEQDFRLEITSGSKAANDDKKIK